MKTIWKFPLTISERQAIEIPANSRFLHIGVDGEGVRCLWFAVDPSSDFIPMEVIVIGTGLDLPHVGDYIGTINVGGYLWHYFCGPGSSINKQISFHYETRDN